ncbi:MAG TPA: hypothetical protein ENG61_02370 [Candidatus Korarchaeota archaeon]|nr:MAG: hypothetical protein DRO05_08755 [Candidatus Korarchaeota archaeon]HDD69187.1 hypothetical protein [Candidatus Korarchaeota archaeon]
MSYSVSSFVYFVQDLAEYFDDFVERLMSQLALRGTAITEQHVESDLAKFKVKYKDERGSLIVIPIGKDIKAVYQVSGGGIIRKAIWGALTGGGLSTIVSSLFEESNKDKLLSLVGGLTAGGAYGAYDGFNTALSEATEFSRMLAEAIRDVERELREIKRGKEAAMEARREALQRLKGELEEVYAELTVLREEIDLAESEGKEVSKAKSRYERAEKLLDEAEEALSSGKEIKAKANLKAARRMIELARNALEEAM